MYSAMEMDRQPSKTVGWPGELGDLAGVLDCVTHDFHGSLLTGW